MYRFDVELKSQIDVILEQKEKEKNDAVYQKEFSLRQEIEDVRRDHAEVVALYTDV